MKQTYEAEGNAFCWRMLALLPLLSSNFAFSPPSIVNVDIQQICKDADLVFASLVNIEEYGTLS